MNEEIMKHIFKKVYCPKCKTEMNETGVCFYSFPAKYEYKCPNCLTTIKVEK